MTTGASADIGDPRNAPEHRPDLFERKYIYGVIRCPRPLTFASKGVAGADHAVRTIHHRDLAAIVSDSPDAEYDSTRRNMTAHMRVLEEAMRDHTVLPVRFGSVAPDIEAVSTGLLKERHDDIAQWLDRMGGKIEMGVKAFWYEDGLYRDIVADHGDIRRLRDRIGQKPLEQTYRERIRLGEMVEGALAEKRRADSATILDALRPLAEDVRVNEPVNERMALNAAFLLPADRQDAFENALGALDREIGARVMFKAVGPAPLYNFIGIVLPDGAGR